MNFVPLALYAVAFVAYAWHFARRNPAVGQTATTLLVAGALAHTFVIGMQTMEAGHVPITSASTAISTFVWLLALAYLYTEMSTDERAMGVFILPLLVALQTIPAMNPGVEARFGRSPRSAVRRPHLVAALCVCELRARLRHRDYLRAPLHRDQSEAPGVLLRAAPFAAGPRPDEPAGHRDWVDFSHRRV